MGNLAKLGLSGLALLGTGFMMITGLAPGGTVVSTCGAAEGPQEYLRVLAPIESGNLLLFPVVRTGKTPGASPFLTLDEGIKSGQVEVTEAGKVRGLVRPRPDGAYRPAQGPQHQPIRGDQVNSLVAG
jgi:hypothetical protein